jgi:hypothetical protein
VAFDELADVNLTRKSDLEGDNKSASELGATGISRDSYGQVRQSVQSVVL